jgi:hypothetical protein
MRSPRTETKSKENKVPNQTANCKLNIFATIFKNKKIKNKIYLMQNQRNETKKSIKN